MTLVRKTLVWLLPVLSSVLMFVSCSAHKKAQRYSYLVEDKPVSPAASAPPASGPRPGTTAQAPAPTAPKPTPAAPAQQPAANHTASNSKRNPNVVAVANRGETATSHRKRKIPSVAPLNADKAAKAEFLVNEALQYKGTRYRRGGTTFSGIDCSGLCVVAYKSVGITIPHQSAAIASSIPTRVSWDDLQPGDILCFNDHSRDGRIDHVGIVVAVKGRTITFVHATTHGGVMVSELNDTHWSRRFRWGVRPLEGTGAAANQRLGLTEIGD